MPVAYPREGTGGRVPPEFGEEGTPMYLSRKILGRHRAIEYSATFDVAINRPILILHAVQNYI
jgi:hypothetical protein